MDGQWDLVISSLQDIYNANEVIQFDDDLNSKRIQFANLSDEQLQNHLTKFQDHMENVKRAHRLLDAVRVNLDTILGYTPPDSSIQPAHKAAKSQSRKNTAPTGMVYWVSQYNPSEGIQNGSEVAYKPRKGGDGEWFQCEVIKIATDGMKFEVRDPEPDELGKTGKIFKCTWKDIILIPSINTPKSLTPNYPAGSKVLARYPETTTFYPAVVIGSKRDGTCRLRFDGEEEVDKETEVPRRLVLPFPMVSSSPAKK
ncbi:Sgf29p NDAI_0G04180 [Naumovozyma dairenensis CBS 421]|uniref:SGF29 C-terminal domain-containing protein n=1 Tax=Naumovozyma dairenensis (strain ATCC 10597 / BCRC 20456 / CBS 421 / NBRC 0211 / NRRL Y-12639) TaxID=1071378 RepID=J7SAY6_NAUDC|nr:hypothetical protein NDAI_0G04180 [Naumovozyma dairenensis CBS 421]CCK73403.1 hypothetical protein NDAI_0G04180 [Naumovozyma dairenensis CBS 421]